MLDEKITIASTEDPQEFEPFDLKRPAPADWNEWQDALAANNIEEGALNLVLACALEKDRARINEIADDQPALVDYMSGQLSMIAGGWVVGANAVEIDVPAMVAAAERAQAIDEMLAGGAVTLADSLKDERAKLAPMLDLAAKCAASGFTLEVAKKIASGFKRGRYFVVLIDDVGVFGWRKPSFGVRAAYQRRMRAKDAAGAFNQLALDCVIYPQPGDALAIFQRLPSLPMSAAVRLRVLANDFAAEAKKGSTPSEAAPAIPSPPAST